MNDRRALAKRLLAAGIVALFLMAVYNMWINTGFATSAHLTFHYHKAIDADITGADLRTLEHIFRGFSHWDPDIPACGFDDSVSVTLTNGRKSITFCPACDGCEKFRIGNTNRYLSVSKDHRKLFNDIVRKYGMTFPCV